MASRVINPSTMKSDLPMTWADFILITGLEIEIYEEHYNALPPDARKWIDQNSKLKEVDPLDMNQGAATFTINDEKF